MATPVRKSVLVCSEPSRTKQSFAAESDINAIVEKHRRTGLVTSVNPRVGFFGDVSGVKDYASSLRLVQEAEGAFMALPSSVRDRFNNDPVRMLAFLEDPGNRVEAEKLGIVQKRDLPVPPPAEVPEPPKP